MTKPSQYTNAKRPSSARCVHAEPVEAVTDLDYGTYLVTTASAPAYVLGIGTESSSLVHSSQYKTVAEWESVPLPRDAETVPLLGNIKLQLGRRAIFRLDVRDEGNETTRTTTPVCVIRRLAE
jgi:hypothetical protein